MVADRVLKWVSDRSASCLLVFDERYVLEKLLHLHRPEQARVQGLAGHFLGDSQLVFLVFKRLELGLEVFR